VGRIGSGVPEEIFSVSPRMSSMAVISYNRSNLQYVTRLLYRLNRSLFCDGMTKSRSNLGWCEPNCRGPSDRWCHPHDSNTA